jgi:NAD-dependent SIR2 family protein deacetylase
VKQITLFHNSQTQLYFNEDGVFFNIKNYIPDTGVEKSINYHQTAALRLFREHYSNFLRKYFRNIVVLASAGTSIDNGEHSGQNRIGLWDIVAKELHGKKDVFNLIEFANKILFLNLSKTELTDDKINVKDERLKDIELLLSKAHLAIEFIKADNEKLINTKIRIESIIKDVCNLSLDDKSKHRLFLKKLTSRSPKDTRLKIFTTNYDTLFEQAAYKYYGIIDGFSYTIPRIFNGRFFDWDFVVREKSRIKNEENFVPNIFHLYKLHGSVNLDRLDDEIVISDSPKNPLIIYPASNKFESSYEQPYFEMMSRFQQELRNDDTLLIVIGFSFYDKHLRNVIKESVESNPGLRMLIVNFNGESEGIRNGLDLESEFMKCFLEKPNVYLLDEPFSEFTLNYPLNETYFNSIINAEQPS